jgi:hypothetical protein
MQDRYAGDVGDFVKFGLLRALGDGAPPLKLGVNWYLAGDESHNADGKHVGYLQPSTRYHASLRSCDPDLMARLAQVVSADRSVAALEESGVLPVDSVTYSARLVDRMGDSARRAWHRDALRSLVAADLVFVDPDNGIRNEHRGSKAGKFAFLDELADYATRGQSLVIYHHADRSAGGVAAQVPRRLAELAEGTDVAPMGAVVARRGSTRYFFIIPAPAHRDRLETAAKAHVGRWAPHVEYLRFVATVSMPS